MSMSKNEIEQMNNEHFMTLAGFRIHHDPVLGTMFRNGSKYVTPNSGKTLPDKIKEFFNRIKNDGTTMDAFSVDATKCKIEDFTCDGFFNNDYLEKLYKNFTDLKFSISIFYNDTDEINFMVADPLFSNVQKFLIDISDRTDDEIIRAVKSAFILISNCFEFDVKINDEIDDPKLSVNDILNYIRGEVEINFVDQNVKEYLSNTREIRKYSKSNIELFSSDQNFIDEQMKELDKNFILAISASAQTK